MLTKREKNLLIVFVVMVVSVGIWLLSTVYLDYISKLDEAIEQQINQNEIFKANLENLHTLYNDDLLREEIEILEQSFYSRESLSSYDFGLEVRSSVERFGVIIERFDVGSLKGVTFINIHFKGTALNYVKFLEHASQDKKAWRFANIQLSKYNANSIQGAMRVEAVFND